MPEKNLTDKIEDVLRAKVDAMRDDARQLLNTLGYHSKKTLSKIWPPQEMLNHFGSKHNGVNEDELRKSARKIAIVFQTGDDEIKRGAGNDQLFAGKFEKDSPRSFFFVVADLKPDDGYSRGRLARMTRAINRCFNAPAIVIFRHNDPKGIRLVSLAFVHRRKGLNSQTRHVLGRVSILRGIRRDKPHRGHLDILADLALSRRLEWVGSKNKPRNFDGLLAAWLNALDIEELNQRFYNELQKWFDHAVKECEFPDGNTIRKKQAQVMRMITRLLFIWFVKEKGLAPEYLFTDEFAADILKNHRHENSDYYRAILQNLFFGTLNTPKTERAFRKRNQPKSGDHFRDNQYGVHAFYRYADLLNAPDEFVQIADSIPFVNGGLFDCLDDLAHGKKTSRPNSRNPRNRVDCFTDYRADRKLLQVPSHLFFDKDEGLFSLFERYKFTVAENTPLNQEVALDPELLGLVFENLLAVVIPESSENARKATGSYYTPREIVEYMVDEALVAYLAGRIGKKNEKRLRQLVSWEEPDKNLFSKKECKAIIDAIDELRILDPAVGSGAFPMGMLHKLVHILSRVDEHNEEWKRKQLESLDNMPDSPSRREAKCAIERVFSKENNYDDYGRKLFLIQHAIHGADLQPVATQIARLRFFISLIIDQKPRKEKDNCGIDPLPNLETKIVAADSLCEIMRQYEQRTLAESPEIEKLKSEINRVRRDYFGAKLRDDKKRIRDRDQNLRNDLKALLTGGGKLKDPESVADANRVANWDLYDQTAWADWFDPDFMMGVRGGFDIVIGNPPYVKVEHMQETRKNQLKALYRELKPGAHRPTGWVDDLYAHFIFRGHQLVRTGGVMIYIANDSFIGFKSKARVRRLFLESDLRRIVRCPPDTFGATIYTAIFLLEKEKSKKSEYETGELRLPDYDYHNFGRVSYETTKRLPHSQFSLRSPKLELVDRLLTDFSNFGKSFSVLDTGIHSGNVRPFLFFAEKEREELSRLLQGRQIERWQICWDVHAAQYKWCDPNYTPQERRGVGRKGSISSKNEYWHFCGDRENHHLPERLFLRQTADNLVAAYHSEADDGQFYTDNTLFTILRSGKSAPNLKYALALLNSRLLNTVYQFLSQEDGKTLAQVKVGMVEKLPLAIGSAADIRKMSGLADKILSAKRKNPEVDVFELAAEIDEIVYRLYGLTAAEIQLVEEEGETEPTDTAAQ